MQKKSKIQLASSPPEIKGILKGNAICTRIQMHANGRVHHHRRRNLGLPTTNRLIHTISAASSPSSKGKNTASAHSIAAGNECPIRLPMAKAVKPWNAAWAYGHTPPPALLARMSEGTDATTQRRALPARQQPAAFAFSMGGGRTEGHGAREHHLPVPGRSRIQEGGPCVHGGLTPIMYGTVAWRRCRH